MRASSVTALATAMSTDRLARHYLRAKVAFDRAAALVLGALGPRLIVRVGE